MPKIKKPAVYEENTIIDENILNKNICKFESFLSLSKTAVRSTRMVKKQSEMYCLKNICCNIHHSDREKANTERNTPSLFLITFIDNRTNINSEEKENKNGKVR